MKQLLSKVFILLVLTFMAAGLAGCGGQSNTEDGYTNLSSQSEQQNNATDQTTSPNIVQDGLEGYVDAGADDAHYSIEELGKIIVSAGAFWEDWWNLRGPFALEHVDNTPWEYRYGADQPGHPHSIGLSLLLSSSGFGSMSDIANHLLQFYTAEWIEREFSDDRTAISDFEMILGDTWAFLEHDGDLYINPNRWGSMRPNWDTATHTLIEQAGNHATVETVVTAYDHRGSGYEMPTAIFTIEFANGRIEAGIGRWQWPDSEPSYAPDREQLDDLPASRVERTTYDVWHGPFQRQWQMFINSSEYVNPRYFASVHARPHAEFDTGAVIWADANLYNVSVITFEPVLVTHEHVEEMRYRMIMHYPNIASVIASGEALYIRGVTGQGSYPNMGIAFTDAYNERHFYAIMHAHSDSLYAFVMWDITAQIDF